MWHYVCASVFFVLGVGRRKRSGGAEGVPPKDKKRSEWHSLFYKECPASGRFFSYISMVSLSPISPCGGEALSMIPAMANLEFA